MVLDAIDQATTRYVATLRTLTDDDVRAPSPLPGWSRGHVAAHVVRNAEAFTEVARARRAGALGVMYPDGLEGRSRGIDELATASATELADHLERVHAAFVAAWDPPPPAGPCATVSELPQFDSSSVPLRRLREVEVHRVDLGLPDTGPDTWLAAYVELDLPLQWETVALRTDVPVVVLDELGTVWSTDPAADEAFDPSVDPSVDPAVIGSVDGSPAPVTVDRRTLLAWILDRAEPAGLPALIPWGDRSRWESTGDATPTRP